MNDSHEEKNKEFDRLSKIVNFMNTGMDFRKYNTSQKFTFSINHLIVKKINKRKTRTRQLNTSSIALVKNAALHANNRKFTDHDPVYA